MCTFGTNINAFMSNFSKYDFCNYCNLKAFNLSIMSPPSCHRTVPPTKQAFPLGTNVLSSKRINGKKKVNYQAIRKFVNPYLSLTACRYYLSLIPQTSDTLTCFLSPDNQKIGEGRSIPFNDFPACLTTPMYQTPKMRIKKLVLYLNYSTTILALLY